MSASADHHNQDTAVADVLHPTSAVAAWSDAVIAKTDDHAEQANAGRNTSRNSTTNPQHWLLECNIDYWYMYTPAAGTAAMSTTDTTGTSNMKGDLRSTGLNLVKCHHNPATTLATLCRSAKMDAVDSPLMRRACTASMRSHTAKQVPSLACGAPHMIQPNAVLRKVFSCYNQ